MAKLLPPYVDGKLPAQSDIARLVIPYRLNRAVGINDFDSIAIKIKDLNTNQDLSAGYIYSDENRQKGEAIFTAISSELKYGKHYKIQLAFQKWETKENGVRELVEGYYSTVGVFKLGTPGISVITNLISSIENTFPFFLQGKYEPVSYDQAEKAYSYRFEIISDGGIKECSEELFTPFYAVKMRPEEGKNYSVKMITTTINGFKSVSKTYTLTTEWDKRVATLEHDLESGRNIISFGGATIGDLYLFEALGDDFKARYINDIIASDENITLYDSNVEHGSKESYHIYKINQQGQPECEYTVDGDSDPTYFDDIFLSDDDREVCIKYNPQISSFKTNILESKQETLGGKYPYFFRNGHVGYNEFPISGLITRLADPSNSNNTIRTSTDAQNDDSLGWSTNLTHDNFAAERKYKMELLKWLNNGKTKLFRSPAEGNYYVRLMNVSLSPNQTLGRMLHTFNCTAYEVEAPKNKMFQNEDKLQVPVIDTPKTITRQVQKGYFSFTVDKVSNVTYSGNENDSITLYDIEGRVEPLESSRNSNIIQIAGFSTNGGTITYSEATPDYSNVSIREVFNDTENKMEIIFDGSVYKIVPYCDARRVSERQREFYIEVDEEKISLGEYNNNEYNEKDIVYSYDDDTMISSLSIGPGVRVRLYSDYLSYELGQQAEWSDFWDKFQFTLKDGQKVPRTDYSYAFRNWSGIEEINPKYPIRTNNIYQMFQHCTNLKKIPHIEPLGEYFTQVFTAFSGCSNLLEVPFDLPIMEQQNHMNSMFQGCKKLVTIGKITIVPYDDTASHSLANAFAQCYALENITFGENSIRSTVSFSDSSKLSAKSVQSIIDGLMTFETNDGNRTIIFNTEISITEAQRKIISDKNWNLKGGKTL